MKHSRIFTVTFAALFISALTGCSNPDAKYSMVGGTITYKGAPVAEATVSFQTTAATDGESASGRTDTNGKFTLTSVGAEDGGRGALPGEYRVFIENREVVPDPDQAAYERGEIDSDELQKRQEKNRGIVAPPKHLLPEKYARGGSSDLKATVVKGKNAPFVFDLTD